MKNGSLRKWLPFYQLGVESRQSYSEMMFLLKYSKDLPIWGKTRKPGPR
ncbi:hypothetical protein [uncultured Brevibacillus sp.]|nr:hypothetical protein [uncultured Brevibacillus sp.]